MTAIVAVDFDWSIESCDKAPSDLDYERNTEKYGRAMKLTIETKNWKAMYLEYMSSLHLKVKCLSIVSQYFLVCFYIVHVLMHLFPVIIYW